MKTPVYNPYNFSPSDAREEAEYYLKRYNESMTSIGDCLETRQWYQEYLEMDNLADDLMAERLAC